MSSRWTKARHVKKMMQRNIDIGRKELKRERELRDRVVVKDEAVAEMAKAGRLPLNIM